MKDINNEIEDILNESPLVDTSKPNKIKGIKKKMKRPKKKTMIIIGVIFIIAFGGFLLISTFGSDANIETISNADFISSIKQQIIEKGYAEIGEGDSKITLSPYLP